MAEDAGQALAAEVLLKDAALLRARDVEGCWRLLAAAAALCRQHRAWRREPFNVFSVLRSGSDEVNLHSRFLAALLDHRKAPGEPRENLKDFLGTVAEHGAFAYELSDRKRIEKARECFKKIITEGSNFTSDSIRIERESNYIDILIANDAEPKWGVAIENKIWAGDQPQQLWRYYDSLTKYGSRTMLYLTLDGHKPEEDSVYDEDREGREDRDRVPEDRLCLISYSGTLLPWLERCQERAYAEPSLREAIEQYLSLVRELTGMNWTEGYMKELKKLCIQGDNAHLIHDLTEALINVKIGLLLQLCEGMEGALKKKIGLPPRTEFSNISWNMINGYVRQSNRYGEFGLYYPLEGYSGAHLGMCIWHHGILLGIQCGKRDHLDTYTKLGEMMRNSGMQGHDAEWWPWRKRPDLLPENFNRDNLVHHKWEHVEFLQKSGEDLAENIAEDLKRVWDTVHGNTPA